MCEERDCCRISETVCIVAAAGLAVTLAVIAAPAVIRKIKAKNDKSSLVKVNYRFSKEF